MPTALQIITQTLPGVTGSGAGAYHPVQASSTSTSIARVPMTLQFFPATTFQDAWNSRALQTALANTTVGVVETEGGINLLSEGDIERASALYLLHAVNLTLDRLHSAGVIPRVECLGQFTVGRSRPDIAFMVNGRMVLVLEYKRTNTIDQQDWEKDALIIPTGPNARTAQQIIDETKRRRLKTLLGNNAGVLAQQASKYSSQCGLVVLFNYQKMIALDFTPKNLNWDDLTNPVNYYYSEGTGLNNTFTHRKLLMSAMVYGLKKLGLMAANA